MAVYLSKTNIKTQFSLVISKLNFHWQNQSLILIGNIKAQFSLATSKVQFSLAILKTQFSLAISKAQLMLALFYQKLKVINTWQNTISKLFHLKVQ